MGEVLHPEYTVVHNEPIATVEAWKNYDAQLSKTGEYEMTSGFRLAAAHGLFQ